MKTLVSQLYQRIYGDSEVHVYISVQNSEFFYNGIFSKHSGSRMAGTGTTSKTSSQRGILYPNKVTTTLSVLKILTGCGMVILGSLALFHKASYARTAVGVWAGKNTFA